MLGLNDLIIEAQGCFDKLEMMIEGLINENELGHYFLDNDAILSSLDSMIFQAQILEEHNRIRKEVDEPNIEQKIARYEADFAQLRDKKNELKQKQLQMETLTIPHLLNQVTEHKAELLVKSLKQAADVIGKMKLVNKDEVNTIFSAAIHITVKRFMIDYIENYV